MILVVGATGLVGSEVCLRLAQRGRRVRGLVRATSSPVTVGALQDAGVELCVGDLREPETLRAACAGVEAIVSTATATASQTPGDSIASVDDQGQLNLVEAAKAAGVDRFVFVSFRKQEGMGVPLADAKARVERAIAAMNFTTIQASWFMDVWLTAKFGFDFAGGTARIFGPGTAPISWVASADVAEMCVLALENAAAGRRVLDLGGPEAVAPLEVVRRFERIGGKSFAVEHVPVDVLQGQFAAAADPMQKSFAALMLGYSFGDAIEMGGLQREFGLSLRSVDDYAHAALGGTLAR